MPVRVAAATRRGRTARAAGLGLSAVLAATCWPAATGQAAVVSKAQSAFHWAQQFPPVRPLGRFAQAMVYDPDRHVVVMFGGFRTACVCALRDTWEWNGRTWRQRFPRTSPPARFGHTMAYVPATRQIVLFGGAADEQGTQLLGDTWTWDGSNWTRHTTTTAPSARYNTAMATDPSGGAVLFSGYRPCQAGCADTWVWSGRSWSRRRPPTKPLIDEGHVMAYDPATRSVLLYSGNEGSGHYGMTWEWNGRNWTRRHPATLPLYNPQGGFAYDPTRRSLIMFGSTGPAGHLTWEWNGADWTQRALLQHPSTRNFPVLATNPGGGVVLFGGVSNRRRGNFSDTWTSN